MTDKKIETYQEIPVDLFDWVIEKYKGVKNGDYGVNLYGLIKFKNQPILIGRTDYGGCHPSYPCTSFQVYDYNPSIFDVIKEGFDALNKSKLEKKVMKKISSSRVTDGRGIKVYNLLYENNSKIKKEYKEVCNEIDDKTEEMLNSGEYSVTESGNSKYWDRIYDQSDKSQPRCFYHFIKLVEKEHKKDITPEEWFKKFKTK